ncbi:MAG: monomethylamine:corrinoid methyltransferase [Deltaproteobacteria bacterium]|nr:monomethylamine:corrinoid methyltransferase [Deltaproteobacteria bacterium]MBW2122248.1 monomethylamine:corrinoid methyltransferase [Deltaproteobacteria bacterium]
MISLYEVIDRVMTGRYCSESEFDMEILVPRIRELVSKYKIKYDPDNPIPSDDGLADRVFQAGFELFRDVGVYCPDTERILRFSEEELCEALAQAPSAPVFGEGKDAKALVARKPESTARPWCFIGAGGAAVSNEELFASIVEAYAGFMPLADSITAPSIVSINGRTVRTGSPLEVLASIRAVVLGREALRRGGRPGLPIMNSIANAGTDTAKIAGTQFGLRPSDGWPVGHTAELKLEYQRFNEIAFLTTFGGHICAETAPILGGYCGGPEGTAVTNVAYHLSGIITMRASLHLTFPTHFNYGCTTTRDVTWAVSVSNQAISRNSHFPLLVISYAAAGPMTEMVYYEIASAITTTVVSGGSIEFGGVAKATHVDHFTPMEPRLASEVAHRVVGMTRKEANGIVKKLLERYEGNLASPPLGKKYAECWDVARRVPGKEYVDFDRKMRKELSNLGIPL